MSKEIQENEIVDLPTLATRYKKKPHSEDVSAYWFSNSLWFLSFEMAHIKASKHNFQSLLAFLLSRVVLYNEMKVWLLLGASQLK